MFPFHTLQDLDHGAPIVGGKRARLAVIGNPVTHSRSPQMQQAALDAAHIEASYIRLLVHDGEFPRAVQRLVELGFLGANVTVPFKKQAFTLASRKDALAELSGAVNTLLFREGEIIGANTDGPGFCQALQTSFGVRPRNRRVTLLGAGGGAGTALACACALDGCAHIALVNRTRERLPALASTLIRAGLSADRITCVAAKDEDAVIHAVGESEILVQATSLGLGENDPPPLPLQALHMNLCVYELVTHDTPLLREARRRNLPASGGEAMLLYQGAEAFRLWFPDSPPDVAAMKRALEHSDERVLPSPSVRNRPA